MNPWKLERGRRVLVNLSNGDAILGKVVDFDRRAIHLGGTELLNREGHSAMDGEAILPNDSVSWIQVF
jgi:hypothetical protein